MRNYPQGNRLAKQPECSSCSGCFLLLASIQGPLDIVHWRMCRHCMQTLPIEWATGCQFAVSTSAKWRELDVLTNRAQLTEEAF